MKMIVRKNKIILTGALVLVVFLCGINFGFAQAVGDVNSDSRISSYDALLVSRHAASRITLTADQLSRADVNGDNKVTQADADMIAKYVIGLISKFEKPVESYKYKVVNEGGTAKVYGSSGGIVNSNSEHSAAIQWALDNLTPGRTSKEKVLIVGDFTIKNTIYIPSYVTWILNGKITLGNHIDKILIADSPSGSTDIDMSGGIYDGNKDNQLVSAAADHVIKFSKVTKSRFKDMIMQNAVNDNFTLDTGSNNNICERLTGRWAGTAYTGPGATNDGNGLDDKGDHNTWIDCIAEDNYSDNWVIKSRDSTFIRAIGRGSKNAVGFGPFADRNITGNKFYDIKAYNNIHAGFAINIPPKSEGKGYRVENNYIQGEFYNNGTNGIRFKDSTTDGSIKNNTIDILTHNNGAIGFWIEQSRITNNSGSLVAYDNASSDLTLLGTSNSFDVYHPIDKPAPKINKGSNTVNVRDFTCPSSISGIWAVKKYCESKQGGNDGAYTYLIYTDGKQVFAKNRASGKVEYSGTMNYVLNSIRKGGNHIYIKDGAYSLSTIELQPNMTIECESQNTIIKAADVPYLIYLKSDSTIKGCTFSNTGKTKTICASGEVKNWRVENNYFINSDIAVLVENLNTGVIKDKEIPDNFPTSGYGYVVNNKGLHSKLITMQGTRNIVVTGNTFTDFNGQEFADFNYNVHHVFFDHNTFINNDGYSISEEAIDMIGGSGYANSYNTVSYNTIIGNFQTGIRPAKRAVYNTIENNYLEFKPGNVKNMAGIYFYGGGSVLSTPKYNKITGNTVIGGKACIELSGADNNVISRNKLCDCDKGINVVKNTYYGADAAPENNKISLNVIDNVNYGIYISSSPNNEIKENTITNYKIADIFKE